MLFENMPFKKILKSLDNSQDTSSTYDIFVKDNDGNILFTFLAKDNDVNIHSLERMYNQYKADEARVFARGDRVKVNSTSGFHVGAFGVVEFVEPAGMKIWVLRDGDSGPKYFYKSELDKIEV